MRGAMRVGGALAALVGALVGLLLAAPWAQAQPFSQCPAVASDTSCQFLVTVSNAGPSVAQDMTQGPYEASDDSLIGVQNSSSKSIAALPLAAPGTSLFGFESDGICDPGMGPLPAGCVPVPGSPGGTTCGAQTLACSFPPPAGEPAKYTEAGAATALPWPNGDRQNGYEGPTSWFSNISADTSSGTVNFSPPIAPGGSTYFSLEAPPSAAAIMVGTPTTTTPGALPPAFGKNGVISIPPANRCLSKRHFRIHIRKHKGLSYVDASVFVGGKAVGVIRGRRITAGVDLRGLPQGTFKIKIVVVTTDGRVIQGTRTYHTCARRPLPGHPHFL